ncbi:MAG TPA: sigma-70 family RNA polymerase sigma factor [Anaerohalosphaeraceae bacterium]|nr:sigma-70 family RNA polymerase sigma factor [Anaerohalosphaeraceae bacterium]HPB93498.1 sigma-70 family RNA polymerase sigma factor [Anaerohalosphaeraceae bacterium]HRT23805.1 sigma-70 family RNA polymerase sigma factor [Anaerohalosphaeraceae bacterium]
MQIHPQHPALRQFLEPFQRASRPEQKKILDNIEKLLLLLNPQKEYPLDFIVFRLSGRRLYGRLQDVLIGGRQVLDDLRVFAVQLSRNLELPALKQTETLYTVSQLAERFSVSAKTIRRWQKYGLLGKHYLFPDGRRRLAFPASVVEQFVSSCSKQLGKAGRFSRLTEEEKRTVIELAAQLQQDTSVRSREPILREVARRLGRARETVRYILAEHDRLYPEKAVFSRPFGRLSAKERAALLKLYKQKTPTRQLMERFGLSYSSVHRIINQQRAKEVLSLKIEYVDSPEFHTPEAFQTILEPSETLLKELSAEPPAVLSRTEETALFRRYNFLKYLAFTERLQIQRSHPSSRRLQRIEQYLNLAEQTQHFLLKVNMPLVIHVAGKHISFGASLPDLVGEGNLSLMAALEKFDYTKGYRFSTYATLAIAKDFARRIPAEASRPDRAGGSDFSQMAQPAASMPLLDLAAVEQAHQSLRQIVERELDERERYVVLNRFPLGEGVIPPRPKTLKEIGQALGLSKERVRQIELQALQKLRRTLSPEQFDLLTG